MSDAKCEARETGAFQSRPEIRLSGGIVSVSLWRCGDGGRICAVEQPQRVCFAGQHRCFPSLERHEFRCEIFGRALALCARRKEDCPERNNKFSGEFARHKRPWCHYSALPAY